MTLEENHLKCFFRDMNFRNVKFGYKIFCKRLIQSEKHVKTCLYTKFEENR